MVCKTRFYLFLKIYTVHSDLKIKKERLKVAYTSEQGFLSSPLLTTLPSPLLLQRNDLGLPGLGFKFTVDYVMAKEGKCDSGHTWARISFVCVVIALEVH